MLRFSIQKQRCSETLDAVVEYMPAPTDIPAIKGVNPERKEDEKTFFR